MRRTALLVALVALAVGLVGCSSETPGSANPGSTSDADGGGVPSFPGGETSTAPSTDPSEGGGSDTADLEPCELLSGPDLAELELPGEEKEERDVGAGRGCQWQASGSHTVTIGIFDELGIDDVVASDPQSVNVGSHEAVQYSTGGTCAVAIAVSDSSRVDVMGTANGDMTRGCQVATKAAELVETKLP